MEYSVIVVSSEKFRDPIQQVVETVNQKMKEGYKPLGGISVVERSGLFYFAQSIIKENPRGKGIYLLPGQRDASQTREE